MSFPIVRHRRLRQNAGIRSMVRETVLQTEDLVQPIFVTYGSGVKSEISSMPGVYHFSLDTLKEEVDKIVSLGIPAVLLFGIPETKDSVGTSGFADDGIVQEATRLGAGTLPGLIGTSLVAFSALQIDDNSSTVRGGMGVREFLPCATSGYGFIWFSVCPPDMRVSAGFFIPKEAIGAPQRTGHAWRRRR